MSTISLTYTTHNISISRFLGNTLPRTYLSQSDFSFSTRGVSLIQGPSYRQKYLWAINALLTRTQATTLDSLFRAWDQARASGQSAVVTIVDSTFGSTVNTQAIISTPPSFSMLNYNNWDVSLGLTEV